MFVLCIGINSCKGRPQIGYFGDTAVSDTSIHDSIINPVLPGFNPDPCILRVKDDYYIVTSTFEWFPAIPIYHSRDLVHWQQLGHVINDENRLNLRGIGNSSGIFAPSIHYFNDKFYVLYTIVSGQFPFLSSANYIISSSSITGPWSDPVFLNCTGFDPALFMDDDGHCYLLNMQLDFYQETTTGGILLQEIDLEHSKLLGEAVNIFKGTCFGTEGPRIYKREGYYYLFTAEGGTDWAHQETVARAKDVRGPYIPDPGTPLITSKGDSLLPVQRAGHASLVHTQNDRWYIAYLGSRPVMPGRKSVLGRESFLHPVVWTEDGWLKLATGGNTPLLKVASPGLQAYTFPAEPYTDSFEGNELMVKYQSLREGFHPDWISLKKQPGKLAIRGRKPFNNLDDQSMLMQRVTSLVGYAETSVEFEPSGYRHMAGLMCFYDTRDFLFLKVTTDEVLGKCIGITIQQGAAINKEEPEKIRVPESVPIFLRVDFRYDSLFFSYAEKKGEWKRIGPKYDLRQLSDENNRYGFTGAMVGLAVYDLVYENRWAYFDYLTYEAK
ncbi:MAG: family 43 glycosylhydrolase [Bacteroidales bacterium]